MEEQTNLSSDSQIKTIAHELAKEQREISIGEFFVRNRHLLGFDNQRKALLTTVKEAVDNSLDACEEAGVLPEINVEVIDMSNNRFRVIVEDNGPGIIKSQIPKIFGKLLYGSKFHKIKMTRGQQGIGISACVMYSHLTTGRPAKIISKIHPQKPANLFELTVDTKKNSAEVMKEEEIIWEKSHGTRIELDIEGSYQKGPQSVDQYLKQTAITNPHVTIIYTNPKAEQIIFPRATEQLPKKTKEIKPHPYGIELGLLLQMAKETKARNMSSFLQTEFSRVSASTAKEICENSGVFPNANPHHLNREMGENLINGIKKTKIIAPPSDCIAPIGEDALEKGLKKEVLAEFYCATTRSPSVYRGYPFIIEVAIAYGGEQTSDKQANILRYANRVPLLYQQGACASTESIQQTNWRNYGMSQSGESIPIGPCTIVVHVASVWVPFTSESKEAIAHYPEIIKEMKLAIQECGRKLSSYIRKKYKVGEELKKRGHIEKFIPHISEVIKNLLKINDSKKEEIEKLLAVILENKRGVIENIEAENVEYDEEFAKIGREEYEDDSKKGKDDGEDE